MLGIYDIITVVQRHGLNWYKHVLRKRIMDYGVESVRPRSRPKKLGSQVTEKDSHIRQICKEDAMGCRKWRKLLKVLHHSHKDRVCVFLVPGRPE